MAELTPNRMMVKSRPMSKGVHPQVDCVPLRVNVFFCIKEKGTRKMLKEGEVVDVRKPPVTYSFRVIKCIEQRVGAKLLPGIYENVTDPKQYEILEMSRISGFVDRARGTGRPTKKDRRSMEAFTEPVMFGFDDDFDDLDDDDDTP